MNRFERILGILLMLRSSDSVAADDLAARFEVSRRTIYRDMDALAALGVPLYAEKGFGGGFRLMEGYFLPPLMFRRDEAVTLVLGLTLLHSLTAHPFAAGAETAERKLLAAVPARLRTVLADTRKIVGFERMPVDLFHPEPDSAPASTAAGAQAAEVFLQGILDRRAVTFRYTSPYRAAGARVGARPLGVLWDRDRWYLVGQTGRAARPAGEHWQLWRADRARDAQLAAPSPADPGRFDVRDVLGGRWLEPAMRRWASEAPVRLRLTPAQAQRLQADWYFRQARYTSQPGGSVLMTYGENDRDLALALVRWLGPGAELLSPLEWRAHLRAELLQIAAAYDKQADRE